MKKGILIFLGIIAFLFILLLTIPFLFKDQIKAKVDEQIAKSVNATVVFDADKLGLSLIRNFPNVTISIDDFGIIGKQEEFKGDTLFFAKNFKVVADIMSVISGDQIKVKSIYLNKPIVATYVTKDGKMSWDIAIATPEDTTAEKAPEEPSKFSVALDKWEIEDGLIIYEDKSLPMYAELRGFSHTGKGDITQDIYDVETYTKSKETVVIFDNVAYLNKHQVEANLNLNINMPKSEYKFLENNIKINNFDFGFDGLIAMPGDDIIYDLTYEAKETDFKDLISLVPAIYTKDYNDLKAEGKVAFNGIVKGKQTATTLPGFTFNLNIDNGSMKYPSLPSAISNIVTDLSVVNNDGIIDNTVINLKKFHMDMDKNPVDARALVEGLNPYKIDANLLAKVKLDDVTKFYPIEGTTLKGLFGADVKVKGTYSDSLKLMPVVDAKMFLQNGYVKTKDFPAALEQMSFNAAVQSSGDMPTSKASLENFKMVMDGEPFEMKASVLNFDNPAYDVNLKGIIDLTKMTKIYPLEDMTVAGRIITDIATKGVLSDVEAGRYDKTSTSGTMKVSNLKYSSKDFPQGMALSSASFTLSPDKMTIDNMDGYLGKSDISVKGFFSNYMGYMFGKQDTVLRGNMSFNSKKFDVNEWMTDEEATTPQAQAEPVDSGLVEIPKNIDFFLASQIGEVLYDNMSLKDLKGNIIMKDGIARLENLVFNSLGGSFLLAKGEYNTKDVEKPSFDFDMKITEIQIKEAFKTFNTVQTFAPMAKNMEGVVSLSLKTNGQMDKYMNPLYPTMSGAGTLAIPNATIKDNPVLATMSKLTMVKELNPLGVKNVIANFKIEGGKLKVEPFDVNAGNFKMNIGGASGFDGGLDYIVKMDVPAGALGSAVNSALGKITGQPASGSENIKLDLKIGGTNSDPKVGIAGSSVQEQGKEQAKTAVENKVKEEIKNNAQIQEAQKQVEDAKKAAEEKVKAEQERIKKEAEEKQKAEQERLKKEAEKGVKDQLKKLPKF
jgi:hypothetical protein